MHAVSDLGASGDLCSVAFVEGTRFVVSDANGSFELREILR